MDLLIVLALVAFLTSAVLSVIAKGYALALIAAGLFIVTLASEKGISIG